MKFYDSIGPNPRVVRMFAAEKAIALPVVTVDLIGGENRQPAYLAKNPTGGLPALELDDGSVITETTVLCEYLEELHPTPVLIGAKPAQRAETRMWTRRIDLGIVEPMINGFRAVEGREMFESRVKIVGAEAAADLKAMSRDRTLWLDGVMAGRAFVCGDRFSLADIVLFAFMSFGGLVGQGVPDEAQWIKSWFERVKARPSAAA